MCRNEYCAWLRRGWDLHRGLFSWMPIFKLGISRPLVSCSVVKCSASVTKWVKQIAARRRSSEGSGRLGRELTRSRACLECVCVWGGGLHSWSCIKPDVVGEACNPSTLLVETAWSGVWSYPQQHNKLGASLGFRQTNERANERTNEWTNQPANQGSHCGIAWYILEWRGNTSWLFVRTESKCNTVVGFC